MIFRLPAQRPGRQRGGNVRRVAELRDDERPRVMTTRVPTRARTRRSPAPNSKGDDAMPWNSSPRRRFRVLFSPLRLSLFIAAIVFAAALYIAYISNGASPEWVGALSVVPLLAFAGWTVATDYTHRQEEKTQSAPKEPH